MAIVLQDVTPRIQALVGAGPQTVFPYPFLIFSPTDLRVYYTVAGSTPDDVADILVYNIGYNVTNNVPPAVGGTITILAPTNVGDIVTIVRAQPDNRLNNYIDGGLFQANTVNYDFDRTVLMSQQNQMYDKVLGLHYNNSAILNPNQITDNVLPVLPANCVWAKNNANTAIVAVTLPAGGGGGGDVILPSVPNKIAYFTNTLGTLNSSLFTIPAADAPANSVLLTNGAGVLGFTPYTFPAGNGTAGQLLSTNGAGILSFVNPGAQAETVPGINRLINGDFQIWQRGAGGSAAFLAIAGGTTEYTADRWQCQVAGAGGSGAVTQVAGATSGSYLARVQRTAANAVAGSVTLATSLTRDMCIGAAGNIVTLSFKAVAGANYSPAGGLLNVNLDTGTGNTDISIFNGGWVGLGGTNYKPVLTNVLTTYSVSTPVLANNVTQLAVLFQMITTGVAGANDWFEITDVQLEVSPAVTPFQRLDFEQQLFRCQRFFNKSFLYGSVPSTAGDQRANDYIISATATGANPNRGPMQFFPSTMLTIPTFTLYNPHNNNAQAFDYVQIADCSGTVVYNAGEKGFAIVAIGDASTVPSDNLEVNWTADCDLT